MKLVIETAAASAGLQPKVRMRRNSMKKYLLAVLSAAVAGAVLVPVASASPSDHPPLDKTVWHLPNLDPAVSEVAGVPLQANYSDNQAEWNYIAGDEGVLGFTCISCSPYASQYDPFNGAYYNMYRTVWFAPEIRDILSNLSAHSYYDQGMAFLTIDHEAMHWRLFSSDEARGNACALKDLPRFLTVDEGVPATTTQTVSVPQQHQVKVRYRAKVHGRYVWRYRYVWRTRYIDQQQTVTNPLITNIVNGATAFYHDQPYPYNAGTC
jgi:hypothetical protein